MEVGTKVIVTKKEGDTVEGTFVSTKAGWTVVLTKAGEIKARAKDVAEKLTKAEAAKRERAAAKAAKDKEKAAAAKAKKAEGDDEEGEDDDRAMVPADLSRYVLHPTKTASGRRHIDVDDGVAKAFREKTLEEAYLFVSKTCEIPVKDLRAKYEHLNPGMQRMNLGNKIRAAYRLAERAIEKAQEKEEKETAKPVKALKAVVDKATKAAAKAAKAETQAQAAA